MDSRLILVEGLPGSGKSSTAQFICDQYQRNLLPCRWWHEEERPHPLATERGPSGAKSSARYRRAQLHRWREFVSREAHTNRAVVVEGRFLLDKIFQLLRVGVIPSRIVTHILKVADLCKPLQPSLLYFHQPDYATALRGVFDQWGKQIESQYILDNDACAYAKLHGLKGFDGLLQFWLEVRSIMEQVVEEMALPGLSIDNTRQEWDQYEQQVGQFLSLPHEQFSAPDLNDYTGVYTYQSNRAPRRVAGQTRLAEDLRVRGQDFTRRVAGQMRQATEYYLEDVEFSIHLEGTDLVLHDYGWLRPPLRLIPKEKDVFLIASWPFELVFKRNSKRTVVSATRTNPTGRWLVTGKHYARTGDIAPSAGQTS